MNGAGRKPRTELTLMIRPLPCSRMWGSTARVIRIEPKTLVSNSARVCSIELSSAAPAMPKPALLTRTSIRPDRSSTSRTTPSTDPSSVTSSGRNTTPPRSSPAAARRLVPYTVNPAPTSARAADSPIPADAPVTSATGRVSRDMTAPSLDCITIIISQSGHNAMNMRTGATDLGGPRQHAERRRRLEGRPQRCPGAAMWSVRPRVRMVAAPESEPGRSARENGPDPRPAADACATGEHYVIRLSLQICLSKIRAGDEAAEHADAAGPRACGVPQLWSWVGCRRDDHLGDRGGVVPGLHPLGQDGFEGLPFPLVDRQWVLTPHHARVEAGARVEGLDEQNPDTALADLVVDGLGVALDRVLGG